MEELGEDRGRRKYEEKQEEKCSRTRARTRSRAEHTSRNSPSSTEHNSADGLALHTSNGRAHSQGQRSEARPWTSGQNEVQYICPTPAAIQQEKLIEKIREPHGRPHSGEARPHS
mmetsp:Transcript_89056/g.240730  ORF Transcript_89056/g.240730 Transcript_89056/m.240730 type:complete len:115 (+) Transcript_89056:280-624(+)